MKTLITIPNVHGKRPPVIEPVKFNQLENGDIFTFDAVDFRNVIFVMIDKSKQENGQCLRLGGNNHQTYLTWFQGSPSEKFILFKNLEVKNPFFGLTS